MDAVINALRYDLPSIEDVVGVYGEVEAAAQAVVELLNERFSAFEDYSDSRMPPDAEVLVNQIADWTKIKDVKVPKVVEPTHRAVNGMLALLQIAFLEGYDLTRELGTSTDDESLLEVNHWRSELSDCLAEIQTQVNSYYGTSPE